MKSCFGGQKRSRVSDLSGGGISLFTTLSASMDEVNEEKKTFFLPGSCGRTDIMDGLVRKKNSVEFCM